MKIIATRSDGGLTIFTMALGSVEFRAMLDAPDQADVIWAAEIAAWEQSAAGVKIVSWRSVEEVLPDRTFRNAWTDDGREIQIDMSKARNIWRDKMRHARAPMLNALDVQVMRAMEQGQSVVSIASRKQALRDVTDDPAIEAAQTPEALKAVWPIILNGAAK